MLADIQSALLTEGIETIYETSTFDTEEPWAVFYETNGGIANGENDFVVHVARTKGRYLILWPDNTHTRTFYCANMVEIISRGLASARQRCESSTSIAYQKPLLLGGLFVPTHKPAESDAIRHVASVVGTNDGASSDHSNHDARQTEAAAAQPTTATPRQRLGCPVQGRCGWSSPQFIPVDAPSERPDNASVSSTSLYVSVAQGLAPTSTAY